MAKRRKKRKSHINSKINKEIDLFIAAMKRKIKQAKHLKQR